MRPVNKKTDPNLNRKTMYYILAATVAISLLAQCLVKILEH